VKFDKKFSACIFFLNSSPKLISAWWFFCSSAWIFGFPTHLPSQSRVVALPTSFLSPTDVVALPTAIAVALPTAIVVTCKLHRNYSELIVRSSNCCVFNYIYFSFLYLFYSYIFKFLNFVDVKFRRCRIYAKFYPINFHCRIFVKLQRSRTRIRIQIRTR
jgi:hypothetical protein